MLYTNRIVEGYSSSQIGISGTGARVPWLGVLQCRLDWGLSSNNS